MNVYQIGRNYIAAENLEKAYYEHLEHENNLEFLFDGISLEPGEETEVTIKVRRLTEKEIDKETIPCCQDGCDECEELNDHVYKTYRELINEGGEFPKLLAFDL
ncbi:hypothetical protein [Paenibacillus sp. 1-18]|uniref:hypothetical protein n=1 Tax=Paenibacillus sp. 1-18 TaxID=1333846 RepID=UPI000470370D|nr:hypothetical protein [Paenibacillus sp. 1-18]